MMQYKFYTIPVGDAELSPMVEEMNAFIRGHRVVNVQRELLPLKDNAAWCFCLEYVDGASSSGNRIGGGREKIDYRTVLDDKAFELFRLLRECRKQLAEEEAVPPFAVFLDEHLAEMTKLPELTPKSLQSINGIGEKKIEKYAKRFLELAEQKRHEEDR